MIEKMELSYYPGCTLKVRAKNLEDSAVASMAALGVNLQEAPRWNCCGAVYSLADDDLIHQLAPVRNLIRVKEQEQEKVAVLCSLCFNTLKRANLLGYPTHAHFVLEENMAKVPDNVYDLLNKLWEPALDMAKREAEDMQAMIDEEGGDFELASWDWWYYAEKIKKAKYALDDEVLRPYLNIPQ